MGSFDVMSEPSALMSRSANKVNRHAASRSNFMQAKEEKPKEFKIDRQATNAANMEILKNNQAAAAANTANRANASRSNAAAAIEFQKDKNAIIEANKRIDERNRMEKQRIDIENQKSKINQYKKTQNPSKPNKKTKKIKGGKNKPNPSSGFPSDRK